MRGVVGLSARETRLIGALLRHPAGLTVADLADRLDVSARTVHRDLDPASEYLADRSLTLVRQAGRGLRVEGEAGVREAVLEELGDFGTLASASEERRAYLLGTLLRADAPIKLRALASRSKVSVGTVSRDLDGAGEWLEGFGLSLLRKRGYGVEVRGKESDRRRAMGALILQNLEGADPLGTGFSAADRLLGLVDAGRLRTVEALTAGAVEGLPYAIADDALVNLSVHVTLMVERLLHGGGIEFGADTVQRLRGTVEHGTARNLAVHIEDEFGVDVPEEEVAYLVMYMRGAKLRQDDALERYFESADLEVASRVSALIHHVEERTGVPLAGDSLLYTGLLAHLERAIHRVRENMRIYNPLLAEVEADYPALFELVTGALEKVFADEEIPKEEAGFVAMHFGAALDRGQGGFPGNVLAICDSGISSSRMLAARLQKAFPQIRQIRNASLFDLEKLDPDDFDLVVSTVGLPLPEGSYVRVGPLLSEDEVGAIRGHLREKSRHDRPADRAASESLEVLGGGQTKFHQMAEATQTIAELMEEVFLERHAARGSVPEAVRLMCGSLAERGLVSETGRLESAIIGRMERGGIGIPGTALALFHARDGSVARPSFSVHDLDEPLEVTGMDGEEMEVRRSMLMVAPLELSPVALEAISEISVAIVEQPAERAVFESGSEAQILATLQGIFARYLQNKLA